jgi:hypothetical protein
MKLYPPSTNLFRVVHAKDIVPHLPNTWQDFAHVGTEVWYPNAGLDLIFKTCPNTSGQPENRNCADTVDPTAVTIEDHMIYVGIDFRQKWCTNGSIFEDGSMSAEEFNEFLQ